MSRAVALENHPRRETILLAVRERDPGWAAGDANPHVDAALGTVLGFIHSSDDVRQGVSPRGVSMIAERKRLAALPGVLSVSGASTVPFDNRPAANYIELQGDAALGARAPKRNANRRFVLPNFFAMLRIPLLAGRSFDASDRGDATPVMIVSESLARREWPTESAIGKQVNVWGR